MRRATRQFWFDALRQAEPGGDLAFMPVRVEVAFDSPQRLSFAQLDEVWAQLRTRVDRELAAYQGRPKGPLLLRCSETAQAMAANLTELAARPTAEAYALQFVRCVVQFGALESAEIPPPAPAPVAEEGVVAE